MKRSIYTLSVLAIASSLSFAQDKPAPDKPPGEKPAARPHTSPEDLFKKLDTNSDGSLTLDEYKAHPRLQKDPAKAEESFKKLDTDKDSKVSLDEFKAGRPARHPGGRGGDKPAAPPPAAPK